MTTATIDHIQLNDEGRAIVAGTRTKVSLVVRDALAGMTPHQIRQAYSNLTLAQIHAALSYYYDHQSEFDAQIANEDREMAAVRQGGSQISRAELERRAEQGENGP